MPEQFIGILDWNKKEIYEGDMLSLREGDVNPETGKNPFSIGTLSYMDGRYVFLTDDDMLEMNECLITGTWDGEVIGNIHENPELLK